MSDQEPVTPTEKGEGETTPNDPKDPNNSANVDPDDASNPEHPDHKKWTDQRGRAEKAEAEAKANADKVSELEKQLAAKGDATGEVSEDDLQSIADKHDVSVDFVKDIFAAAQGSASKAAEKLVSDKLSEQDKEREKERILNSFKTDFDKVAADDAWEGTELSEQAVRMHFLAEKAKNSAHTVEDSIEAIYGSFKKGKATVEDDPQGADQAGESIDFTKLSKDPEKLNKVLKDPKARTAYYKWRDQEGI